MSDPSPIPLARPDISEDERSAVSAVLDSGRLVCGPRVEAFEQAVSDKLGGRHAVAFSSGTAALWAVLRCLDLHPGDEVIVPALTFPATVASVMFNDATPVLAEVHAGTFDIEPHDVATRVTGRTRVVLTVDQFGLPADYPAVEDVLRRHGDVKLVTDAACSLGSVLDSTPCGCFGEAAVFSFHPRKIITTGEGGMALTDHAGLADELKRLRSHGVDTSGSYVEPGVNLRMDEMAGALGCAQMARLDGFIEKRRALARVYRDNLPEGARMQHVPPTAQPNYQTLAVLLDRGHDRDSVVTSLRAHGIESTVASFFVGALPAYSSLAPDPSQFVDAIAVHERGLALPMHTALTEGDVQRVCDTLGRILSGATHG